MKCPVCDCSMETADGVATCSHCGSRMCADFQHDESKVITFGCGSCLKLNKTCKGGFK